MANAWNVGSVAIFIVQNIVGIPAGVSGNLVQLVELNKGYVANFTGQSISSDNIPEAFQGAITDFSKADVIDLVQAQVGGEDIRLGDLSISESGDAMSAEQYRLLGNMKLKVIGRGIRFVRSLS